MTDQAGSRLRDFQLGSFAVQRRLLTAAEVNVCLLELSLREQQGRPTTLGALLIEKGRITDYQLEALERTYTGNSTDVDETSELLLGRLVLERSLATPEQIRSSLEQQAELARSGINRRLGDLLIDSGTLARDQVEHLLGQHTRRLLRCATCSSRFLVKGYDAETSYRCKHCRGVLAEVVETVETEAPASSDTQIIDSRLDAFDFADDSSSSYDVIPGVDGHEFAGYDIVERIAEGTMGWVYKVRKQGRTFALKILKEPEDERSDARVLRFQGEARACQRINHPYVITVHEFGEHAGMHFLVMDYIEGQSLRDYIENHRLRLDEGVSAVIRVAQGLEAAHAAGVIHRDLKPANILVRTNGEPVITDFGLARDLVDNPRITRAGFAVGTPNYMSPEQVRGERDSIGPSTDIYALGVILYQIIAGDVPFSANTTPELFVRINDGRPESPRAKNPAVTRKLERICLKAMHHDPAHRYQTAQELVAELMGCLPSGSLKLPGHRARVREERRHQRFLELLAEGKSLLEQGCLTEARETLRRAAVENDDPRELLDELAPYLYDETREHLDNAVALLLALEDIAGWRPLVEALRLPRHPLPAVLTDIADDQVLRFLRQASRSRSQALADKAAKLRREIYLDREQFLAVWFLPERSGEQQRAALLYFHDSLVARGKDPARVLTQILSKIEIDRAEQIGLVLTRQSDQFFAQARAHQQMNDHARARRLLDLTLLFAPANLIALLARAELLERMGERSSAKADLKAAIQLAPDNRALARHLETLDHEDRP